ncbi:MAG TPA: hypothetical protein IAD16_09670 [Candidatus Fimisoma avicola]|uniref:Uncharacterized protein n=1 Tax=Candidatus Fimisoma avicola TaxID=2840826 RepID=A0A9D1L905_9FIRM|nr:hypothetical protein [Candidatus Fimisoma avicola]
MTDPLKTGCACGGGMTVLLKDEPCGYGGMGRAKSRRNGLKNLLEHLKNPLEQNLKNPLEQSLKNPLEQKTLSFLDER